MSFELLNQLNLSNMKEFLLKIGLASADVRLKKGKALWRELGGFLPLAGGDENGDKERLELFVKMLRQEKPYARKCLEEWLETEIAFIDLGLSPDTKNVRAIYRQHLNCMEELSWNS